MPCTIARFIALGRSAGKLVAALALVKDVIDVLINAVGRTREYCRLTDELTARRSAFLGLRDVFVGEQRSAQVVALHQQAV